MPETAGQERTEKATPKKREQARKKGQVAISREVSSAMVMLASLGFFYFAGSWMFWNLSEIITRVYQNIGTLRFNTVNDASNFSMEVLERLLAILIPFFLPLAVTSGALLSIGCFTTDPEFGGATSILNDDGPRTLDDVLKPEPPPLRPDNHLELVDESHGAVSVQFNEDLRKTARGPDKEPGDD